MSLDSTPVRWTVLAIVNIPLYLGLGYVLFGDWQGFWDCVRYWFTPDWVSLFRGEYWEDCWSEAKLFLFAALCLLALYGEYRFFFGDPFQHAALLPGSGSQSLDRSLEGAPRYFVSQSQLLRQLRA